MRSENLLARIERLEKLLLGTRIERLEKLLLQSEPEGEVRANRFVLVDKNGATRLVLTAREDMPGLLLNDQNGNTRVVFTAMDEATGLVLNDQNGETRLTLVAEENSGRVEVLDENGEDRVCLSSAETGGVHLSGEAGEAMLVAGEEMVGLILTDENGNVSKILTAATP